MLGELQATLPQNLSPVDNRMHQDILTLFETVGLIPCEDPVPGDTGSVLHDLFAPYAFFIIDKVADQHVQAVIFRETAEHIQHLIINFGIELVITVHDFEELAGGVLDPCIDSAAMSLVGLVDGPDDIRIFLLVTVSDLSCSVRGSVIDQQDLDLIAAF